MYVQYVTQTNIEIRQRNKQRKNTQKEKEGKKRRAVKTETQIDSVTRIRDSIRCFDSMKENVN